MARNGKNTMVSLEPWILKEIIGPSNNKSARIRELLMKGWMYEKEHRGDRRVLADGTVVKEPDALVKEPDALIEILSQVPGFLGIVETAGIPGGEGTGWGVAGFL